MTDRSNTDKIKALASLYSELEDAAANLLEILRGYDHILPPDVHGAMERLREALEDEE